MNGQPVAPKAAAVLPFARSTCGSVTVVAVQVGPDLTYTITVTNNGPEDATNVTVTDTLPSGVSLESAAGCTGTNTVSCSLVTLPSGATATVTIVVTTMQTGSITNTASVSGTESDPNTANNSASVTTTVTATSPPSTAPTVSSCSPPSGSRGQQLTVQVSGSNFPSGATVSFGDRVTIQSVTFVSATQLTVRIKVNPQAASGARTVAITNPDGQSGGFPGCFTVN
jgi:uncharacterized repeat protein (TIGR01451 family)